MYFGWNEKTINWMQSASDFTGFHRHLCDFLEPLVSQDGTLCDIGCGIGLVDVELAGRWSGLSITCLDPDAPALAALGEMAADRGVGNIKTVCARSEELSGEWDVILSVFYGSGEQCLSWLPHCKARLISVIADENSPSFSVHRAPRRKTARRTRELFSEAGLRFSERRLALEYGQPFTDEQDARDFMSVYGVAEDTEMIETRDEKFPLYLPKTKLFSIFTVEKTIN